MDDTPLIIGLDLGTSRCKAAALTPAGDAVAFADATLTTYRPYQGWSEQDANEWWSVAIQVLRRVAEQLGKRAHRVQSIGVSAHGPSLVLVGKGLKPLVRCPTWQDLRSASVGRQLLNRVGHGWIGLGLPETSFAAKLAWAREHQPEYVRTAAGIMGTKSFLLACLTGEACDEPSSCSAKGEWPVDVFNYLGIPLALLPKILPSDAVVGPILPEVARKTGLPRHAMVVPGLNDGAAACLGAGLIERGQGVVSLSTNAVARRVLSSMLSSERLLAESLFCYPYVIGLYIGGGFTKCGGDSLRWFADLVGDPTKTAAVDIERITIEANSSPPGARGVIFLPYLAGRGSPSSDDQPWGAFLGLSRDHRRADLARALLEGVAFSLREIIVVFDDDEEPCSDLRLTGGGSSSALWRQILADVLRKSLTYTTEDSVLGAAVIASVATGIHPNYHDAIRLMVRPGRLVEPTPDAAAAYDQVRRSFKAYQSAVQSANLPAPVLVRQ